MTNRRVALTQYRQSILYYLTVLACFSTGCQETATPSVSKNSLHRTSEAITNVSATSLSQTASTTGPNTAFEFTSKGIAVTAADINQENLNRWQGHYDQIIVVLNDASVKTEVTTAAQKIKQKGLKLGYFIEVGRNPQMADSHPRWMASLQGHPEWRKQFPDVAQPNKRQVIKNYPWVPILYQEAFSAHLNRIKSCLNSLPEADAIFLNDLQAAPSACGCGHPLCRWTVDYGPIQTATPLGNDAAAKFTQAVGKLAPNANIIPIFVSECEQADKDTVCCGVACFEGRCWKDFTKQLDPLADVATQIGVACFYKEFDRDLARYNHAAGFVSYALDSFQSMPKNRDGKGVEPSRLIAVLQGWDVKPEEIQAQIDRAGESGATGYLLITVPIDQSWEPRIFDLPDDFQLPQEPAPDHNHDQVHKH